MSTELPESDQVKLWKVMYAWRSFHHVSLTCDFILESGISEDHPIYYPLLAAIHVLYSRPFKRSNIVGKITEDIIPKEYNNLHKALIGLRDQVVAHLDADGPHLGDNPANHVRFVVHPNRSVDIGLSELKGRVPNVKRIQQLMEILTKKMLYHRDRICDRHKRDFLQGPGEY